MNIEAVKNDKVEVVKNDKEFEETVEKSKDTDMLFVVGFLPYEYDKNDDKDPLTASFPFLEHFADAVGGDSNKFKIVLFNVHDSECNKENERDERDEGNEDNKSNEENQENEGEKDNENNEDHQDNQESKNNKKEKKNQSIASKYGVEAIQSPHFFLFKGGQEIFRIAQLHELHQAHSEHAAHSAKTKSTKPKASATENSKKHSPILKAARKTILRNKKKDEK